MSKRLDQEREARLEPVRIRKAVDVLQKMGYETKVESKSVTFIHNGNKLTYFPYSGWLSGKGVKDGRGLDNMLKQLREAKLEYVAGRVGE